MAYALAQVGKDYVWGGTGPDGFDCSGLTMMAWQQVGVNIPRVAQAQYDQLPKVPVTQAQRGDLIFYSQGGGPTGIFHVALYIGDGQVVHAINPRHGIKVTDIHWQSGLVAHATRPQY